MRTTRPWRARRSPCYRGRVCSRSRLATPTPMPKANRMQRRPRSRRRREEAGGGPSSSLDLNRLDLVPDLDPFDDILARCELTEVCVLLVQEVGVALHDEELRVVVERRVLAACDPERTGLEGEVVVLARHALATGAGSFRVAALDDPILDAMEREAVIEATPRFRDEALDGLRCLVRAQRERERSALGELDGGLRWFGRCRSSSRRGDATICSPSTITAYRQRPDAKFSGPAWDAGPASRRSGRLRRARGGDRGPRPALRVPADRDADRRGSWGVHEVGGRSERHCRLRDVRRLAARPGRPRAPPGGHGGGDARFPRARTAPRAATGALLLLRADVPRSAAAAAALSPVLAMGSRVLWSRGAARGCRDRRLHRAPVLRGRPPKLRARAEHRRRREVPAQGQSGPCRILREEPRCPLGRVEGAPRAQPDAHPRLEGPEGPCDRRGPAGDARAPLRRGSRALRSGHRGSGAPRSSVQGVADARSWT